MIRALVWISEFGWKLLPQYRFNNETGEWKHYKKLDFKERKWLGNISYASGSFSYADPVGILGDVPDLETTLNEAEKIFEEAEKIGCRMQIPDQKLLFSEIWDLKWFMLPSEAQDLMKNPKVERNPDFKPFTTKTYQKVEKVVTFSGSYLTEFRISDTLTKTLQNGTKFKLEPLKNSGSKINNGVENTDENIVTSTLNSEHLEKSTSNPTKSPNSNQDSSSVCAPGEVCLLTSPRQPISSPKIKAKWKPPSKDIFKPFLEAMTQFNMVKSDDKVLVCLSGGKDSLTLLHTMRQYQFYAKKTFGIEFKLGAVTVDPLRLVFNEI